MRKELTAALTALVLVITTIGTGPVAYAGSAAAKEEIKSFTKVENSRGVNKNTIERKVTGKAYAPNDKVTVIVELKSVPLLEHFKKEQKAGFRTSGQDISFDEYAVTYEAERITDGLLKQQKNVSDRIQAFKTEKNKAEIIYNYTAVLNGFAIRVNYGSLEEIKKLPNVKTAYIAGSYEKIEPVMDTSTHTIGAVPTWDLDLKGEGTIVAILDTGLDTGHTGFHKEPDEPKYSKADIQQKIANSAGLKSGVTNAGTTYVSAKIPYAYDYADYDPEVTPSLEAVVENGNDHGTHVAGTIAAPDGDGDGITGVAPETQLMIMKVFSDVIGVTGAYTEDILAALDDSVTLGADVINMSLGSPSGFTYEEEVSVSDVYDRIAEAGITMAVSAGNSYSASYNNGLDGYALSGNPDTSVVGSPSTYTASTSVASVVNANYHAAYFEVGGEKITYTETAAGSQPIFRDLTVVSGGAVEYVPIPGAGEAGDYDGIEVNGKIALVRRGTISFNDKLRGAVSGGAIGIVVYNNQPGTISMAITDYEIPAVSITAEDGEKLLEAEDKILTVSEEVGTFPDENANQLSGFSSWGVTPDLKLKPEIAAPGENIYSTLPFDKYGSMSGTSMAAPHIAGTFALVKQYLNTSAKFSTEVEKSELANALLMSTATPAKNSEGIYYSPRKQGSGIVNVFNAVNTDAYLYVTDEKEANQRPKLNLLDDPLKTGVYEKSFQVKSVTGSAISFIPQITTLTETAEDGIISETPGTIGETPYDISGDTEVEISVNGEVTDIITLQPREDVEVTVKIRLSEDTKEYLDTSFENGEFIDGFVILDSVETNYDLTIPFMGFYGDWTQAPLFDSGSANDLQGYQQTIHALYTDGGYSYLGVNPFDEYAYALIGEYNPYLYPELYEDTPMADPDKIAISPNDDDSFDSLDIAQISLLRNAKSLNWSITDDNNVIGSGSYIYQTKTIYNPNYALAVPTFIEDIYWDGTDGAGNLLDNNSVVTFTVEGELDYEEHDQNNSGNILSFPVAIDMEPPTLEGVTDEEDNIQITVKDNQYAAAVFLFDKTDLVNPVASCLLDEDTKNMPTRINIDLDELGLSDKTASDLAVVIFDYAFNQEYYFLDEDITPTPTTSPTPTGPETSPTPTIPEVSPTPTGPETSPTPTIPEVSPTPTGPETSPTPTIPEVSPTPTGPETSPTPTIPEVSPSPTGPETSPTPTVITPTPTNPSVPVTPTPTTKPTHRPDPDTTTKLPSTTPTATPTPTQTPTPTEEPTPVPAIDLVTVTPAAVTLYVGQTSKITVKWPSALTKDDKTSLTFRSSKKSIADINASGTITAKKAGSAVITTKVTINGSSRDFTASLTVKDPYISFGKKPATVYTGNSCDFSAKAYGLKNKITYRVSDTKLAAINKTTGKLTAKKAGTLYVTAKAGSVTKKLKVTVKNPYISFTRKQAALKVGKVFDFNVKTYGLSGKISYRVSDIKLASINKKTGILKAKKAGTVYVIAKVGTVTKKYKVQLQNR